MMAESLTGSGFHPCLRAGGPRGVVDDLLTTFYFNITIKLSTNKNLFFMDVQRIIFKELKKSVLKKAFSGEL